MNDRVNGVVNFLLEILNGMVELWVKLEIKILL